MHRKQRQHSEVHMSSLKRLFGSRSFTAGTTGNKTDAALRTKHSSAIGQKGALPYECMDCQYRYHGICQGTPEQQLNNCMELASSAQK